MKMKIRKLLTVFLAFAMVVTICLSLTDNIYASNSMPTVSDGTEVDVWLMAGQSNSVGYGENYPSDDAYSSDKALLDAGVSNVWYYGKDEGNANNPSEFVPVTFGLGQTTSRSGAEIGIATALADNGRMNAVIKLAYGSSFLYPYTTADITIKRGSWTSPSYVERHGLDVTDNKIGDLYFSFLDTVREGIDMLRASGYTPVIRGMLFMQGEAETFKDYTAAAYQELLTDFINDIRRDLGDVSGQALGEMPFAFTKVTKNPNSEHGAPEILAALGAAQESVAADTALTNVHIIDTTADLSDPASGEYREPSWNIYTTDGEELTVEHDRWHYDALTQQMIGEAAVAKINSSYGILTAYGIIPYSTDDPELADAYFAIFGKAGSGYFFDSIKSTNKDATTRAVELAETVGSESVILLLKDYSSTSTTDFCTDAAQANGHITIDLNEHTLSCAAVMRTQQNKAAVNDSFVTVKNGNYLCYKYGFIYGAIRADSTIPTSFNVEFENVTIGFSENTTATSLVTNAMVNSLDADDETVNINFNYNFKNCVIDMVTNRTKDTCYIGAASKYASHKQEDVTVTFEGCDIKLKKLADFAFYRPSEGDALYITKDSGGEWGNISITADISNATLPGTDMGYPTSLSLTKNGDADAEGFITYTLSPCADITTAYGNIPFDNADSKAFPFALFISSDEEYEFYNAYATYKEVMEQARNLTKNAASAAEEVVVLLRCDYTSAESSDYPSYMSNTSTKITVDLAGHTLSVYTVMNTRHNESTTADGSIAFKNGSVLTLKDALLYLQVGSRYETSTTLNVEFENVYVGFADNNTGRTNLVVCSMQTRGSTTTNATFDVRFKNCTIDLRSNINESANFGDPTRQEGPTLDDVKITVDGGEIIAYDHSQIRFSDADDGDTISFAGNNLPKIYLSLDAIEPTEQFEYGCSDDENCILVLSESGQAENGYRLYGFEKTEKPDYDYSFAVVGDTQYMTRWDALQKNGVQSTTQHLKQVYDWLLANKDSKNIKYVMGLGDITDSYNKSYSQVLSSGYAFDTAKEWEIAYGQISRLDGSIPYSVVRGNHDNEAYFEQYFNNDSYKSQLSGFYSDSSVLNAYSKFEVGSEKYLLLLLDDNPTNSVIEWASDVISANSDYRVIINTHTYISYKGELIDHNIPEMAYAVGELNKGKDGISETDDEYENDGKELWDKLVSKHENIVLVLCGHDSYARDIVRKVRIGENGNAVTEMLICPQSLDGNEERELKRGMVAMLYFSNNGKNIRVEYISTAETNASEDGKDVYYNAEVNNREYNLMAAPLITKYGPIYYEYRDEEQYPLAVFSNNDFIGAYSAWNEALSAATKNLSGLEPDAKTVEILLRGDVNANSFANTSQMGGLLVIDLDGNTLLGGKDCILSGTGKYYSGELMCNTAIKFINGDITVSANPIVSFSIWSERYYYTKTMDFVFENVNFAYQANATSKYLIAGSSNASGDTDATKTMPVTMVFNGCSFDLVTNAPDSSGLFDFNDNMSTVNATAYINGGTIKTKADAVSSLYSVGGNDGVKFGKYNADYTIIEAQNAIAEEYLDSYNENVGKLIPILNKKDGVYTLMHTKALNYTPKTSITLGSELVYNVYVPVVDCLKSYTVDGNTYGDAKIVTLDDGNQYYHIAVPMAASEAARNVVLKATVTIDGKDYMGTWTMSIPKYSKKVLTSDANATEKTLIKDVLAYIKAAYIYFDAYDKEETVKVIDEILGDYNYAFSKVEGTTNTNNGLWGVVIVLEDKPAIRFVLPEGVTADSYTFKSNNTTLKYSVGTKIIGEKTHYYAEISLYAYQMINEIEYTDGTNSGTWHINSYYDFVTTDNELKNDANLINIVEKLYNYCKSAEAYRSSVTNK